MNNMSKPGPKRLEFLKRKMIAVMEESGEIRDELKSHTIRTSNHFIIQIPQKFQHWFGTNNVIVQGLNASITVMMPYGYELMIKDCDESWESKYGKDESGKVHTMFDTGLKLSITDSGLLILPNDWTGLEEIQRVPDLFFIDAGSELLILKGHRVCICDEPQCAKCLVSNCEDPFCLFHDLEDKIRRREHNTNELRILTNYFKIKNRTIENLEEYRENGYFEILGESLSVKHCPNLYEMYITSKSNLEAQLKSIADAWHEGSVISASQAFESDLQHG